MRRRTLWGGVWIAAYIASIFVANWLVANFHPIEVWPGIYAPAGVLVAGLAFTFRDFAQDTAGRLAVVLAILAGAGLSALVGGRLWIASGVAFLASETLDMAVYTPLRERSWSGAVAASNAVGAVIDSVLFLSIAFGSLAFMPGQLIGKAEATIPFVIVIALSRRQRAAFA